MMLTAYAVLAVWFFLVDMVAGEFAGSKPRPFAAAALACLWPLSAAFAIVGSAIIIGRLRTKAGETP